MIYLLLLILCGGKFKRDSHLLFCVPRPTPLTSALENLAAALGGEVGPPIVRVLTLTSPQPSGVCKVSKATPHIGSYLNGAPNWGFNFLVVILSTLEGIPCSFSLPTPSSTPSAPLS